ncbi:MAG: hypothetical protein HXX11_01460 [Desulfuromonadales bacterium]|nr:hypothetical protein [Desulfuromonadales bacterium]
MKMPNRSITALLMTVIYLLITLLPLAPLAMHSKSVAHAVTGQCSGDCDICGCSPERRASHTCCCWLNKLKKNHAHLDDKKNVPSCCKNKPPRKVVELTCNCPCGSNKLFSLWGAEQNQHVPFRYSVSTPLPRVQLHTHPSPECLTSLHGEPPDPPPKVSVRS